MSDLRNIITDIVEPAIAQRKNLAAVIGILQGNCASIHGFGQIDGTEEPLGDTTIYEIGSITKVFTSVLLACLVNQESVKLEDSVVHLLPELPQFPPAITLKHLATHTAGLPRLPRNLWWSVLKNSSNPYAAYMPEHLLAYLRNFKRAGKIGQFSYSNLGVGLLGHILERVTHLSYEQLIKRYITQSIGLVDTCITLTPEQQGRFAPGHTCAGKRTANWDFPTLAGAGALRATGQDLLRFLDANIDTEIDHLKQAFALCQTTQTPGERFNNPAFIGGGLGWFLVKLPGCEEPLLWHNGATGGYQSYLGLLKARRLGVVVLANHGLGKREALSGQDFADTIGDRICNALVAIG
jgi:CubicO group peptidase (beta-lactamase class C family)